MNNKIKKVLVANRGEIAIRVMRTCRDLSIKTVAIYSEVDVRSPHVRYADEAICVGPAPSSQSYLNMDNIMSACRKTGADAIHPGYGFLSENADFSAKIAGNDLIFIGPSADSIRIMGDKLASKQAVKNFDVPLIPGMDEAIDDVSKAKSIANEIGYPIMIKAKAGGGGKGMRIVQDPKDFESQMQRAVSEAEKSFSDSAVFIEKYIESPKHIEVQLMGDQHGNYVYFFERECSIQRRNQKIIEEAPSMVINPEKRREIGETAVNVARACNYCGAGTVEFVADKDLNFFFLEMNTRLQVEHPVTELITGVDLVKEQINVANGNPLSYKQDDLSIRGHSIEVRVYAEDPENDFLPDTGKLTTYRRPQGPGVRVDDGYEEGMEIPIQYDPMISKLITYGEDRNEAIARMIRAIDEYEITGVRTGLRFCRQVLKHPAFLDGSFTTKFIEEHPIDSVSKQDEEDEDLIAIIASLEAPGKTSQPSAPAFKNSSGRSNWKLRARNG